VPPSRRDEPGVEPPGSSAPTRGGGCAAPGSAASGDSCSAGAASTASGCGTCGGAGSLSALAGLHKRTRGQGSYG